MARTRRKNVKNLPALPALDWQIMLEAVALEAECARLAALHAQVEREIAQHFETINRRFAAELAEQAAVIAELHALQAEQMKRQARARERFGFKPAEQPRAPRRPAAESADGRKLYRQIAQVCHPDKTEDANLHGLFMAARTARAERDIDALRQIWKQVKAVRKGGRSIFTSAPQNALRLRRERAVQDVRDTRERLESARNGPRMKAITVYREIVQHQGEAQALAIMRGEILARTRAAKNELAALRNPPRFQFPTYFTI